MEVQYALHFLRNFLYIQTPHDKHRSDHITPPWEYCGIPYCLENPVQTCKCVIPAPGAQMPPLLQPPLPSLLLLPSSVWYGLTTMNQFGPAP